MGTSQSSNGSPSGVPLVPPWVPPLEDEAQQLPPNPMEEPEATDETDPSPQQLETAEIGRYRGARISLGRFAQTGSAQSLRTGVGRYIKQGLGGAKTATQRHGATVATSRQLNSVLSALARGESGIEGVDLSSLRSASVDQLLDAIVEAVRPVDGTQDAEAGRRSVRDSLSELLDTFPNADLLNLNNDQRAFAMERFLAADVFKRFSLEMGKHVQARAANASMAMSRLKEVRDYIRETISASFRKVSGDHVNPANISRIASNTLRDAFEVFEEYAR